MATLTANSPRDYEIGSRNELAMVASDIIYEGAAVGEDSASGYARPLVAADAFMGFAEAKADNSDGSAGDKRVRVITEGKVKLAVAAVAITDYLAPVYASDDNTFTLVSTSNSRIGYVYRFVESGVAIVHFDVRPLA